MPRFRAPAISALIALRGLALPAFVISISVFGLAGQVQAATIKFPFTGQVTEVSDEPQLEALGVVLGALVFGRLFFSSTMPDFDPSPNVGDYRQNQFSVAIGIGQYSVGSEPSPGARGITVLNDFEGRDEYRVNAGGPDTFSISGAEIFLVDPTGTVFSSDALPLVLPSLSEFATAEGRITRGGIRFRLTSFNVVPEPTSVLLLSVALVGLVTLRRRLAR